MCVVFILKSTSLTVFSIHEIVEVVCLVFDKCLLVL
jgi:hypothetical protein